MTLAGSYGEMNYQKRLWCRKPKYMEFNFVERLIVLQLSHPVFLRSWNDYFVWSRPLLVWKSVSKSGRVAITRIERGYHTIRRWWWAIGGQRWQGTTTWWTWLAKCVAPLTFFALWSHPQPPTVHSMVSRCHVFTTQEYFTYPYRNFQGTEEISSAKLKQLHRNDILCPVIYGTPAMIKNFVATLSTKMSFSREIKPISTVSYKIRFRPWLLWFSRNVANNK